MAKLRQPFSVVGVIDDQMDSTQFGSHALHSSGRLVATNQQHVPPFYLSRS
jgi:hypothetical protein